MEDDKDHVTIAPPASRHNQPQHGDGHQRAPSSTRWGVAPPAAPPPASSPFAPPPSITGNSSAAAAASIDTSSRMGGGEGAAARMMAKMGYQVRVLNCILLLFGAVELSCCGRRARVSVGRGRAWRRRCGWSRLPPASVTVA
jgi:hypothetical protein